MKILLQAIKSLLRGIEARLTKLLTDNIDSEINSHLAGKLNKNNPVATGSFSLGRHSDSKTGKNSYAAGIDVWASGDYSHAEGCGSSASGEGSHAEGFNTAASGEHSHAEGIDTTAVGECSHAEGYDTRAYSNYQHVQGKFNIGDAHGKYAHIVGNGEDTNHRSNAHTLDWGGVGWFAGGLKVGGTGQDDPEAVNVLTTADMDSIVAAFIAAIPIYNGEVENA